MGKVTMQDIADYLHISKNTVSQALRGKNGASTATKEAVIAAAKELGYHYEGIKTNTKVLNILLLSTSFALSQTSFFGEIVKSIQAKAIEDNFSLTIKEITSTMIKTMEIPKEISQYDGILILSHSKNSYIKKIIDQNIPVVLIDHHAPSLLADTVLTKNTDGAFLAVQALAKHNYQHVGFIGDTSFSPSYSERYKGFQQAITHFNLSCTEETIITAIEESQGALFSKLNQIKRMPDAWFCVNSGLAFMLNSYLQSKELRIPKDIGIICFDDTEFTRTAQPRITNIATDLAYMGQLAVQTLQDRIQNPTSPFLHKQIVPTLNFYESI